MSATTVLTAILPIDFALALSSPTVGTAVQAGDVQVGEQTLLNNWKLVRDGNPTVGGCWNFGRTTNSPPLSNTPAITCVGLAVTGAVVSGTGQTALTATGGSATGSNVAGAGAIITGGDGASPGDGNVGALITAGANSNGYGARGVGNGAGAGVEGQGGANGNGGKFTGGATSGHGVDATSQDPQSAAVKGTAAASGGVNGHSFWAAGGGYNCDTTTPGASPPANTLYKDKFVAAEAMISTGSTALGGGLSGSTINCTVKVDGVDATLLNVTFDTNMAGSNYVVLYGTAEYTTPTTILIPLTLYGSKAAAGFSMRVRNASTGALVNFVTEPNTVSFDLVVIGPQ